MGFGGQFERYTYDFVVYTGILLLMFRLFSRDETDGTFGEPNIPFIYDNF